MKTLLLFLTFTLLGGAAAHAGLGETDAQIEARYGPSQDGPHPGIGCYWKMYSSGSIRRLCVIFIDGKSEYEDYQAGDRFSVAEVKAILRTSERAGAKWFSVDDDGAEPDEKSKELSLLASAYIIGTNRNEIASGYASESTVHIASAKWERMHHHQVGNGSAAPPEWLDASKDSTR